MGPMEKQLKDYGGVAPFVFGAYGEINKSFDKFLQQAASMGSLRLREALYVKSKARASAILLYVLRRKIASAIFRAQLNCLQSLMEQVGYTGQARADQRRVIARRRFFPDGDPAAAATQYWNAHHTMGDEDLYL